ncbi:MAG: methionyl-tRNA formyltransferase [Thermoguttaceae bacterium]|nr:methionyl-tRNA formyltransferase [Thermoguttaceae bacterium]
MKIIAMANGGFAIPTLRALAASRHELVGIVAMPVRTRKDGVPPIRAAAAGFLADVPLFDPENVNEPEGVELVRSLNADLIFICDYGRILSKDVLTATRLGGLNLHGSLLPKYRGAAPINRAIQAGERELGVSVIFIEPKVDAGPIVAIGSYRPTLDETAVEVEARLAEIGAPLVLEALDKIERGDVAPIVQEETAATKAPKLRKEEGRVVWTRTTAEIIDQYRAFQPWPRAYADWVKASAPEAEPTRLILGPFAAVPCDASDAAPGTVVAVEKTAFVVKTGDGAASVLSVQPSGKKAMTAEAFLRGYQIKVGDRLQ